MVKHNAPSRKCSAIFCDNFSAVVMFRLRRNSPTNNISWVRRTYSSGLCLHHFSPSVLYPRHQCSSFFLQHSQFHIHTVQLKTTRYLILQLSSN